MSWPSGSALVSWLACGTQWGVVLFIALMCGRCDVWSQSEVDPPKPRGTLMLMPMEVGLTGAGHVRLQTKLFKHEGRAYLLVLSETKEGNRIQTTSLSFDARGHRNAQHNNSLTLSPLSSAPIDWELPPFSMGHWHADKVSFGWFDLAPLQAHWRQSVKRKNRLRTTTLRFDDHTSATRTERQYASLLAWWAAEVDLDDPEHFSNVMKSSPRQQMRMMKAARRAVRRAARREGLD